MSIEHHRFSARIRYNLEELVVMKDDGQMSQDLTALVNDPSDENFETWINVFRAARSFGNLGDGSLNRNAKGICSRAYYRTFLALLHCPLRLCLFMFRCHRIFCFLKGRCKSFCKIR